MLLLRCLRGSYSYSYRIWPKKMLLGSNILVTETQTDTEMINFSKTHAETNTETIFNTDTI